MQTTTIERVEGKLTVDARLAVKTLNLCEHNLYCLLVAAEKNAIDDCGELAGITRKHVEDAAQFLGITSNTTKHTAPALWASAIVNLDYSGLTKEDRAELNNWLANNGLSFVDCLEVSDEYIATFNGLLTTVCDYTFKQ